MRFAAPLLLLLALAACTSAPPGAVPPQAVPPSAAPPRDVPPQDVPPQAVSPQAVSPQATVPRPADASASVVSRIVDGDTIWVDGEVRVRLLEVDTPEIASHPPDCWGPEATAALTALLPVGATVYLLADQQDRDRYDRLLRYAWTDQGTFVNLQLVLDGHARAVLYGPDDAHIDLLRQAELQAQQAQRGLWGPPCHVPADPVRAAAQGLVGGCDPSYPTLCLPPPPPDLQCGDLEQRRIPVLPPDPHHLDGDGNGLGCERASGGSPLVEESPATGEKSTTGGLRSHPAGT